MYNSGVSVVFLLYFQYSMSFRIKPDLNTSLIIDGQPESFGAINRGSVPNYYDWRDQEMVSPVKNQLSCGACWAFSTIAAIESHMKIYLGKEMILSEQFLIDCDPSNAGCGNADILQTYSNIKFGGILQIRDYPPYDDRQLTCRDRHAPRYKLVTGYGRVLNDEDIMADILYKYGPLSVAINSASMINYSNGIDEPTDENCDPKKLDHAVLIVGYNVYVSEDRKKVVPYWIIKNSWGTDWGDHGFYYLVRGRNACGVASDVSFPYVK